MRERSVRAQLYEPNVKFGIEDRDWLIIGAITLLPFIVLFLLDTFVFPMRVRYIPFYVFTTPVCLIGSVLFFRTIHIDKPGRWFEHNLQAWLEASVHEAVNPGEGDNDDWIICDESCELPRYPTNENAATPLERIIRESCGSVSATTPLERAINR